MPGEEACRGSGGYGDRVDRDAVLRRPTARWLTGGSRVFRLRVSQLRQIVEDTTIGNLVHAGSLANARTACGRQARTIRPMRAVGTYGSAPGTGRVPANPARSQATERTFMYSFRAPYPPRRRPAGCLSRGLADVSRLTPYRWATVLQAGQADSRLPLPAEDARPQISRDVRCRGTPGGSSAAAFVPDVLGRVGVPSP